jgi:hypothetical protein
VDDAFRVLYEVFRVLFFGAAYLTPSIIAYVPHHHNAFAIPALNLITGWTLIGWVVALVWALTTVREEE